MPKQHDLNYAFMLDMTHVKKLKTAILKTVLSEAWANNDIIKDNINHMGFRVS